MYLKNISCVSTFLFIKQYHFEKIYMFTKGEWILEK